MKKTEEIIYEYSEKIKKHLPVAIKKILPYLREVDKSEAKKFEEILKDFVSRGKLLRGVLYLLFSNFYGSRRIKELLDLAVAIEITHSGLLIHDDIMDNSNLRRGKPSLHRYYYFEGKKLKVSQPKRYGEGLAICFADICFFASFLIINKTSFDKRVKDNLIDYFNNQLLRVGLAQIIDLKFGFSSFEPNLKEITNLYKYKTANYTFVSPMVLGYLSSGKRDKQEIRNLEKIGYSLGIVFQIVDDLLSFLGDEKVIGKDIGSDIKENKKTLLRYFILQEIKRSGLSFLKKFFGNKNLSLRKLNILRNFYFKKNLNFFIDEIINREVNKAKKNILKLQIKNKDKEKLISLIDYLNKRIK